MPDHLLFPVFDCLVADIEYQLTDTESVLLFASDETLVYRRLDAERQWVLRATDALMRLCRCAAFDVVELAAERRRQLDFYQSG